MYCRQCGKPSRESAKFCAECGTSMAAPPPADAAASAPAGAADEGALTPMASAGAYAAGAALALQATCTHCGSAAPPVGYFSKPVHVALLVVATTFYFFPGLIYFLSRKDRLVCRNCGRWRSSLAARAAAQMVLVRHARTGEMPAIVLPDRNESAERDLLGARQSKRSAVFWGVASGACVALAVGSGIGFLAGAVGCGTIAVWRLVRSSKLEETGLEKKKNHEALRILQLAKTHGGELSVSEVAASLNMTLAEAERALDAMVDGVHVEMEVSDAGRVRYLFPELQPVAARS